MRISEERIRLILMPNWGRVDEGKKRLGDPEKEYFRDETILMLMEEVNLGEKC